MPSTTIKAGWKTSEFWLTIVVTVIGALNNIGLFSSPEAIKIVTMIMAGLSIMGYTYGRSLVKSSS